MKYIKFSAIVLLISMLSLFDCEIKPTGPEDVRLYIFTLQTSTSSAISGAVVSIQTRQSNYTETTNSKGKCEISIPNEVSLPRYVIVTADHNNIMPYAFSVSGDQDSKCNKTITCKSAPSRTLVREVKLHHLGNDYYTGPENSQLQIPTQGVELSFSFYLSSIPGSMPYYRIFARGIQEPTEIKINGITINRLGDSAVNGDLSFYNHQLTANPSTVFRIGTNILTIRTGYYSDHDPYDDIEFCGLLLYYP